jgi:choline dehydrogenase-like flavoprotein
MTADYVVVGGGTAGCVVASRLSEDPDVTVTVIEAGRSDEHEPRARDIRRWAEMLESEYDLDYRSVPQTRGNSGIRQARMRILGGCSTANTMITWRPLPADLDEWAALGVSGWDTQSIHDAYARILAPVAPVADKDRNPYVADVVDSAQRALDLPARTAWNSDPDFAATGVGAGFFEIGYTPESHLRSATSVHYLHDAIRNRPNLVVEHGQHAQRLLIQDGSAVGVLTRDDHYDEHEFLAGREVIVCCGAIDSPKLLQLSRNRSSGCARRGRRPDIGVLTGRRRKPDGSRRGTAIARGVEMPERIISIAPNVAKPHSRGRIWITSADPDSPPSIDYRYFTDPDGHDEAVLIAGIRLARRIAATAPMADWVVREVFPGPDAQSDEELSEALRATHQTVYHVSGTCRMGADDDPLAVCDSRLKVRSVNGLRVVDASVFPTIPSVNPVGTIMAVAEHASAMLLADHQSARTSADLS